LLAYLIDCRFEEIHSGIIKLKTASNETNPHGMKERMLLKEQK